MLRANTSERSAICSKDMVVPCSESTLRISRSRAPRKSTSAHMACCKESTSIRVPANAMRENLASLPYLAIAEHDVTAYGISAIEIVDAASTNLHANDLRRVRLNGTEGAVDRNAVFHADAADAEQRSAAGIHKHMINMCALGNDCVNCEIPELAIEQRSGGHIDRGGLLVEEAA